MINNEFMENFRPTKYQGVIECLIISSIFSFALFLQGSNISILIRCIISFVLIFGYLGYFHKYMNTNGIKKTFMEKYSVKIIVIVLYLHAIYWNIDFMLFLILQVHLYFLIMFCMENCFTAGEIFLNSHILATLCEFTYNSENLSFFIIMYPILILVIFPIIYSITTAIFPAKTLIGKSFLPIILILCWTIFKVQNNEIQEIIWTLLNIMFGRQLKITLILYWALLIIISIFLFYKITQFLKLNLVSSRKLFHLLSFILFLPGFIYVVFLAYFNNENIV